MRKDLSNIFSSATWPDYSVSGVRVGWVDRRKVDGEFPQIIQLLKAIPGVDLKILKMDEGNFSELDLALFYESTEIIVGLKEDLKLSSTLYQAALMGRAIVTDSKSENFLNHGENSLVVNDDLQSFAEAVLLLRDSPAMRKELGQNVKARIKERAAACAE